MVYPLGPALRRTPSSRNMRTLVSTTSPSLVLELVSVLPQLNRDLYHLLAKESSQCATGGNDAVARD